jgi:hypothetical protein
MASRGQRCGFEGHNVCPAAVQKWNDHCPRSSDRNTSKKRDQVMSDLARHGFRFCIAAERSIVHLPV